jgi:TetR/AcrR family transcriptional regulator, transcriptional repressor for nem operon
MLDDAPTSSLRRYFMPQPKWRKHQTRKRILEAAARLFAAHGFRATSIESVMVACGLTRGGFYAHFRSKAHLYEDASRLMDPIAASPGDVASDAWLEDLFSACERGVLASAWTSLSTDVASTSSHVRTRYARAIEALHARLNAQQSSREEGDPALAQLAMLIGALAICSTADDHTLRTSLIQACRSALQDEGVEEPPSFFWAVDRTLAQPPIQQH